MTYLFKCRAGLCAQRSTTAYGAVPDCPHGMRRDYRAESFGLGHGVRVSRDGTELDQAKVFLPSPKEFAGPADPDGQRGLRHFYDTHQPKDPKGKHLRPGLDPKRV